jgi:uncharacterized paraquat-inducible protein A
VKRITFCPVCGATAPHEAERCPACDVPLRGERRRRLSGAGLRTPSRATLLGALVLLGVLAALLVYALT